MQPEGLLIVISAPSGAGKTTLCRELTRRFPNLRESISYTTRLPRPVRLTASTIILSPWNASKK